MKRINNMILSGWATVAQVLGLTPAHTEAVAAASITITFEKCLDPSSGRFIGTVAGECGTGSVVYEGIVFDNSKDIWRLKGAYTITTDDCSFTAICSGKVNSHTGLIVLNGEVVAGSADFAGAQVQVRAQLVGPNAECSVGTITLTPKQEANQ